MIKGGGACLLWERIVADASDRMVAVVDDSKVVETLGAFPLPIEVIPFSWESTRRSIARLLAKHGYSDPELRLRTRDGETVVTDSGNYIIDAHLQAITDPLVLDAELNWIPGVVENGLLTGIADEVVIGFADGRHEVRDTSAAPSARPTTTLREGRAPVAGRSPAAARRRRSIISDFRLKLLRRIRHAFFTDQELWGAQWGRSSFPKRWAARCFCYSGAVWSPTWCWPSRKA